MAYIGDALAVGVVASLSRPGGNITGSTYFLSELMAKRLELLKEAMPWITAGRGKFLVKPDNPLFLPDAAIAGGCCRVVGSKVATIRGARSHGI